MSSHPIESLFATTMESIQHMIDVNTVIGDPIETPDGLLIIPVSRVSFGFAVGGGNLAALVDAAQGSSAQSHEGDFGGGSGAGVTVQPVAFLIIDEDEVLFLPVDEDNPYLKLAGILPDVAREIRDAINGEQEDPPSSVRA